ncbi:MAG: hypothetical protein WD971_05530 [Pirellulales bacterium]
MTSDVRRKALTLLAEVWALSPDVRLGQLMAHLGFLGEAHVGHGLGDVDDDELMAILERHKAELEARLQGAPNPTLPAASSTVATSGSPISFQAAPS